MDFADMCALTNLDSADFNASLQLPGPKKCLQGLIWVCLKMLCTPKPNGFADHYPYEKWLFHWEY